MGGGVDAGEAAPIVIIASNAFAATKRKPVTANVADLFSAK
jgi:hypothetical protein